MVLFLGLLAVAVTFLTVSVMKNVLFAKTLWSHTCCCLTAWASFGVKSRFSSGIGEPHILQRLYFYLSRILIEVWQQLKSISSGKFYSVLLTWVVG